MGLVRGSQLTRLCHSAVTNSTTKYGAASELLAKPFKSIPGPKSLPILGSLLNYAPIVGEYSFDRLHHSGMLKYQQYGKLVREQFPGVNLLYLYDPADIETMFSIEGRYPHRISHLVLQKLRLDTPDQHPSAGLLSTNGEDWGKMRSLYQKALAVDNIRSFIPSSDNVVQELCENLRQHEDKNAKCIHVNNLLPHLMRLALDLVGLNFFGVRFNAANLVPLHYTQQDIVEAAETINSLTLEMEKGFQLWRWVDTPKFKLLRDCTAKLENTAHYFVQTHLDKSIENLCIVKDWLQHSRNDIRNVVTMATDMILAGLDTTSYSLGFVFYHLGRNPKCQEILFDELKKLLPNLDSPITPETLNSCTYLRQVVKESLRLNPISVGVGRLLTKDGNISGYHIPAETYCITQNQVSCRLPEYFASPNDFIPERWEVEQRRSTKVHPYLLLPFGHGPRACIGRRLAEQQMYIITARLIRNFYIEWNGSKALDCKSTTINKPDAPLKFKLIHRPT